MLARTTNILYVYIYIYIYLYIYIYIYLSLSLYIYIYIYTQPFAGFSVIQCSAKPRCALANSAATMGCSASSSGDSSGTTGRAGGVGGSSRGSNSCALAGHRAWLSSLYMLIYIYMHNIYMYTYFMNIYLSLYIYTYVLACVSIRFWTPHWWFSFRCPFKTAA